MRLPFLVFLLFPVLIAASEAENCPFSVRDTIPSVSHQVTPNINVVTGEYLEEECDLVVAGAQPLSLRRFYTQFTGYHPVYNYWRFNPEHCCVGNFEFASERMFVAVCERDGSTICLDKDNTGRFFFDLSKQSSFVHLDQTGQTHPGHTKIHYWKGDQQHYYMYHFQPGNKYRWEGEIVTGDGTKKTFKTDLHDWLNNIRVYKYPHIQELRDEYENIKPEAWTPYLLPLTEERLPNGNILAYTFESLYPEDRAPSFYLLTSITAYNGSKTKELGRLNFHYNCCTESKGSVMGIKVVGSDNREANFQYDYISERGGQGSDYCNLKLLSSATFPNKPPVSYLPASSSKRRYKSGNRIRTVQRPGGRCYLTDYCDDGKAHARYVAAGPNGEELVQTHRYVYHQGGTNVFEADGVQTVYRYDSNKRITTIESYQDNQLYRIERNSWDGSNGRLTCKQIEDRNGNVVWRAYYGYDNNHNVVHERIGGETSILDIHRVFSEDGFNLKLTESDRPGKEIRYAYLPNTNLLTSELVFENGQIRKRTFHFYDDCAIRIKTIVDDGSSENPYDLSHVQLRLITEVKPKQSIPCFGLPEEVQEKTIDAQGNEILLKKVCYAYHPSGQVEREDHYDANGCYRYSIHNQYDQCERLIATIDPLGHRTSFSYDDNFNLIAQTGPRPDMCQEWKYDFINQPIEEKIRWNTIDLVTKKQYDCHGRITSLVDCYGAKTTYTYGLLNTTVCRPDQSIEKKEYDILGNVIAETNALGEVTRKEYDFRSQVTHVLYPDQTQEFFTYNLTGTLASHVDRNGIKAVYQYDMFDHPIKKEVFSPEGELLKVTTAIYSPFHKLSETDPEGIETIYQYDFAGRKIAERTLNRETIYAYDEWGRLSRTQQGDAVTISLYDLLGNLVEKRIEDLEGNVTFKENYTYDESGQLTNTVTCQGQTCTEYFRNLPIRQISPDGYVTRFEYDFQGHFTKMLIDPMGVSRCEAYDSRGRLQDVQIKDPAGKCLQRRRFEYDPAGNQTKSIESVYEGDVLIKSVVNEWEYGPNGRLERLIESGSKETRYFYDAHGRLATLIKPDGTELCHEYDSLSRLKRLFSSRKDIDYTYTYDRNDRVIAIFDAVMQRTTKRTYDEYGNLLQEDLANGLSLKSTYDPYARRQTLTYPDKSQAVFSYHTNKLSQINYGGLTYAYQCRNLAGKPTAIAFPKGFIEIGYDSCLRWDKIRTPVFEANEYHYDPRGSLISYQFTDQLGKSERHYSYDLLNQLIAENGHHYSYDSHYNRLSKDDQKYTLNDLFQVTSDSCTSFEYDLNGNLIRAKGLELFYDSLDRLIEVRKEGKSYCYAYDALNRRLIKRTPKETIHYLWDDKNEIGSSDKELRVLGEGFGAEIGAAVFIKLKNEIFVPIHDQRGALIALADKQGKARETIRYTAYGEETAGKGISPWRFASKRYDEETGFNYFGRRYYVPSLGRWITADPFGFKDGPNLYAYVHNSPLLGCDPNGLWHTSLAGSRNAADFIGRLFRSVFETVELVGQHMIPIPGVRDIVESVGRAGRGGSFFDVCDYRKNYSRIETIPGKIVPGETITYKNGMGVRYDEGLKDAKYTSTTHGGVRVIFLYAGTYGFISDLLLAGIEKLGILTPSVIMTANYYGNTLKEDPTHKFINYSHSRGATETLNAASFFSKEERNQFTIRTLGPATLIQQKSFGKVENHVSKCDLVSWTNPIACIKALLDPNSNVKFLSPSSLNPLTEHTIAGDTYRQVIEGYGEEYIKVNNL